MPVIGAAAAPAVDVGEFLQVPEFAHEHDGPAAVAADDVSHRRPTPGPGARLARPGQGLPALADPTARLVPQLGHVADPLESCLQDKPGMILLPPADVGVILHTNPRSLWARAPGQPAA